MIWAAAAVAAEPRLEGGELVVREGDREVLRLLLSDLSCPDTYDCSSVRWVDGLLELREEGRINHLFRSTSTWTLHPWPLTVARRSSHVPEFGAPGLELSLDHATLQGSFRSTFEERKLDARGRPLPIVDVKAPFGTALGTCAVTIDASSADAVIHGPVGEAQDARMSVVLVSDRELWIEVADDVVRTGGESWLLDDHVELWSGAEGDAAVQWAIGLDGTVVDAAGAPPARPTATVERTADGARMRVELPWAPNRLTVVWSDSDDGARQERLIATSRLHRGDPGSYSPVVRAQAVTRCELGPDGLAPRLVDVSGRSWDELRGALR